MEKVKTYWPVVALVAFLGFMTFISPNFTTNPELKVTQQSIDGVVLVAVRAAVPEAGSVPGGAPIRTGWGTGFFVDKNVIVTNNHVIEDSKEILVKGHKSLQAFPAHVIATDPDVDIAIIKLDDPDEFIRQNHPQILNLETNLLNIKLGERVLAIGHPGGIDFEYTVTDGILSNIGTQISNTDNFFLQSTTDLHPGNSGGPLIAMNGRVVGLNDAIVPMQGGEVSLSISAPLVYKVVRDFINNNGKIRWAKLDIPVTKDGDHQYVMVAKDPGNKLFQEGDALVRLWDKFYGAGGIPIIRPEVFILNLRILDPGDPVKVEIIRNGKHMLITSKMVVDSR